jgi:hypothetical protein
MLRELIVDVFRVLVWKLSLRAARMKVSYSRIKGTHSGGYFSDKDIRWNLLYDYTMHFYQPCWIPMGSEMKLCCWICLLFLYLPGNGMESEVSLVWQQDFSFEELQFEGSRDFGTGSGLTTNSLFGMGEVFGDFGLKSFFIALTFLSFSMVSGTLDYSMTPLSMSLLINL